MTSLVSMTRTLSALILAALVVAACAPAASPAPSAPSQSPVGPAVAATPAAAPAPTRPAAQPSPTPAPERPAAAAPPTPVAARTGETPKRGGVLTYWSRTSAPTFDPHRNRLSLTYGAGSPIFDTLVRHSFDDKTVIQPAIASRWEVSGDGTVYTFSLDPANRWHDGKSVTAEDVVFSLEKMVDKNRAVDTVRLFPTFKKAEAVNAQTVKVQLSSASSNFLNFLTVGYSVVLPKHVAGADVSDKSTAFLVGSGPFKLKRDIPGVSWEVERNPNYHIQGLPYLDGIKNYVIADRGTQIAALVTGRVDMAHPSVAYSAKEEIDDLIASAPKAIVQYTAYPTLRNVWLNFKTNDAPWRDARVRQALRLVVDQKEIILGASGSEKFGTAGGYGAPGTPFALPEADLNKALGYDMPNAQRVQKAKDLLKEAGYPNGFKAKLLVRSANPLFTRVAQIVADQVKRIGVELTLDHQEVAVASGRVLKGEFEWYLEAVTGTIGDPDELISAWRTGEVSNYGGYTNPAFDKLYAESLRVLGAERVAKVQAAERELWKDIPSLGLYYTGYAMAWQPYVKGFRNPDTFYFSWSLFDKVWLDK
ncbi:MAG: ABC transporter substrate-binding protein [Dehalococcoidia bacterium]|nr:ABC transporter substrate-binding protein [Dehalococcoidia bacterium]